MASSYSTENYNLNKWVESDIPEMSDFNLDNEIIDEALSTHANDTVVHISKQERTKWNNAIHFQLYYGNGSASQAVALTCDFSPRMCIVFSSGTLPGLTDFTNKSHYNYFGIATTSGSVLGLSLSGKTLTAQQNTVPVMSTEFRQYNEKGASYIIVAFR